MNTINRRALVAGAALAAIAAPTAIQAITQPHDPIIDLYRQWEAAYRAVQAALPASDGDEFDQAVRRMDEASNRVCDTPATTWRGVMLKIRVLRRDLEGDVGTHGEQFALEVFQDVERLLTQGGVV